MNRRAFSTNSACRREAGQQRQQLASAHACHGAHGLGGWDSGAGKQARMQRLEGCVGNLPCNGECSLQLEMHAGKSTTRRTLMAVRK